MTGKRATSDIRVLGDIGLAAIRELERSGISFAIMGDSDDLHSFVSGASGIITPLTTRVDASLMDAAGSGLRVIANVAAGTDNIDVAAASERGIEVTNTPGVLDEATADLTLALILATARRVIEADRFVRSGAPWSWGIDLFVGVDVSSNTTLGIVGLGNIGLAVARRAAAFRMRILATGSRATSTEAQVLGVEAVPLAELLRRSDIVTVHCPLTRETHHLIGSAELAAMPPGSVLINTSRGPVVDEAALVDALRAGHLSGAGLDVFEWEPQISAGLLDHPNVITLPHIGSAGRATRDRMSSLAAANAIAVCRGEAARNRVST